MKRITINFAVVVNVVASWLALAYSGPMLHALSAYNVEPFTQVKLLAFTVCFYGIVLALGRFFNVFKPLAIALILLAAPAWFYMTEYGIVIDANMVINAIETDSAEARDQLSVGLFVAVTALGVIPSLLLFYIKMPRARPITQVKQSILSVVCFSLLAVSITLTSYDELASLFRNHRDVKYRVIPFNVVSASVSAIKHRFATPRQFIPLGEDAVQSKSFSAPRVMVIVLGETARADHFSVNGYARPTTPKLTELKASGAVGSYKNAESCGTATAVSVPCMFSFFTAENYSVTARNSSNVLDVLETAGISATWIDNNSGCKDVCNRINTITMSGDRCGQSTCSDLSMLKELTAWLQSVSKDSVLVLHQMGSHGPAYFERSSKEYKRFLPECKSRELPDCTTDEIQNAYDNSLVVTDQLVSQVIRALMRHPELDSSMMYVSDHGESLGDNGVYLHGLPNWIAPKEQRHIPWVVWPGKRFQLDGAGANRSINHDNFSHTLLGYFNVSTTLYNKRLDLTQTNEGYSDAAFAP